MAVLGRGSMRDREKEEELRGSGDPKYGHLQVFVIICIYIRNILYRCTALFLAFSNIILLKPRLQTNNIHIYISMFRKNYMLKSLRTLPPQKRTLGLRLR